MAIIEKNIFLLSASRRPIQEARSMDPNKTLNMTMLCDFL